MPKAFYVYKLKPKIDHYPYNDRVHYISNRPNPLTYNTFGIVTHNHRLSLETYNAYGIERKFHQLKLWVNGSQAAGIVAEIAIKNRPNE